MAQPTVAELTWFVDLPESRSMNTFHYDKTGTAWAIGDAATLRTAAQAAFLLDWPGCITVHCTIVRCIVRILNAVFDDESDSGVLAVAGGISDTTFPAGTAGVIKKLTDTPKRVGQGRTFLSGLAENAHVNSQFNSGGGAIPALMVEIATTHVVGPDSYVPSVWSRKMEALYPITNVTANPILGHIRGRRPPAF